MIDFLLPEDVTWIAFLKHKDGDIFPVKYYERLDEASIRKIINISYVDVFIISLETREEHQKKINSLIYKKETKNLADDMTLHEISNSCKVMNKFYKLNKKEQEHCKELIDLIYRSNKLLEK